MDAAFLWIMGAAAVGLITWVVLANRSKELFAVVIEEGKARSLRGRVPESFLHDVAQICQLWSIEQGVIRVFRGPRGDHLICEGQQISAHRLAFVNAWNHPIE